MSFLESMRRAKELEVAQAMEKVPLAELRKGLKKARHGFAKALKGKGRVSLIAEFKKSSPSMGKINEKADLGHFMRLYDTYADAVSILTEPTHFGGSLGTLAQARKLTKKPILRKDFILHEYQVIEARKNGSDAVLLIAGFVPLERLAALRKATERLGMDALVECCDEESLGQALASGARILGINNRRLDTLEEHFSTTARILAAIPRREREKLVIVSESAISSRAQIDALRGNVDAVLAGTAIMSARLPEIKLKELSGRTLVKFCGMTSAEDAEQAVKLGADVIGINFYENSPRFVTIAQARRIVEAVRDKALCAGVFVNEKLYRVGMVCREAGLDIIQLSGDENPAYARSLEAPVIKAIHVRDVESIGKAMDFDTDTIMLDSYSEGLYGGTGKAFDHSSIAGNPLPGKRIVLSGGLDQDNVKGVIKRFRPFMVDVCSGIEKAPGVKSHERMASFMRAVSEAEK